MPVITATVRAPSGATVNLDFYVDDPDAPTQWFALTDTQATTGSEQLPHFAVIF